MCTRVPGTSSVHTPQLVRRYLRYPCLTTDNSNNTQSVPVHTHIRWYMAYTYPLYSLEKGRLLYLKLYPFVIILECSQKFNVVPVRCTNKKLVLFTVLGKKKICKKFSSTFFFVRFALATPSGYGSLILLVFCYFFSSLTFVLFKKKQKQLQPLFLVFLFKSHQH